MKDLHQQLVRLLDEGERVAVATIVRGRGSRPREVGAKMLVAPDGRAWGSVGGGALEASVLADCRQALADGIPRTAGYDLTEHGERSVGMTCGGSVEVFIEVLEPSRRLVIFGAGHVGRALAQAARLAGLAVTVVDDRAEWLDPAAFPPGAALHRCARDYADGLPEVGPDDLAAVMTRCHATDVAVLARLAATPPRYVGFIGSRRKVRLAFDALASDHGVPAGFLESVRGPIGLDIGAETPGEIAIAVAAEIVRELRGAQRGRRGAEAGAGPP